MKDITTILNKAFGTQRLWNVSGFYDAIDVINETGNLNASLCEAEENWTQLIFKQNLVIGYLWKRYPLLIVEENFAKELKGIATGDEIVLLTVEKLVQKELYLNSDLLQIDSDLKYLIQPFSAEDLWFETNH